MKDREKRLSYIRQPYPTDRESAKALVRGAPRVPPGLKLAPSPKALPLIGHTPTFARDPLKFLTTSTREHGKVVRLRFAALPGHIINDPALVKLVMHERARIYGKQTRGFEKLKMILGRGLVTSEGAFWLRQRRIAQPAFHRARIESFGHGMVKATTELIDRWREGSVIDVSEEMMALTLRIVGETLLGTDVTAEANKIGSAVSYVIADVNDRISELLDIPLSVPVKRNREFRKHRATLDRVVFKMIEQRRKQDDPGDDLLGMFMSARYEDTGEGMSSQQLRDEVMTMFLAGHETTSNALTWTFMLLSRSPSVRRRLKQEIDEVLGDRPATVDDASRLVFTERVIKESMRLYPPVWLIARSPTQDDELGGYHIPRGSLVFVSPYTLHHDPDLFPDPEGFDPDRFKTEPDRFAYMPFGAGPRRCIGSAFAMLEAKLILATITQRFALNLVPEHRVEPETTVTLRPLGGLKVHVRAFA